MIKIVSGIALLLLSLFTFALDVGGNHGHIMFRPWMQEDWWLWGIILIAGISGIALLGSQILKKLRQRVQ
jgi:hypothetical protein